MAFTAEQWMSATDTAFLWHARVRMAPFVTGVVEDAFDDGHGRLDAKIWGVLPVAHARGLEVDRGEAQRYLAELAWCPAAFLHNPHLRYRVLSDDSVRVWVHDESTYVDLDFDDSGNIAKVRTETRARGTEVQPWAGRFSDYRDFGDIVAPSRAEVWWDTPDGPFVYWRGELVSIRWDADPPIGCRSI